MKAMILAAGYGTRLRPLTERLPKPLLPVGGRPLLEWNLLLLKKHGITDALINLHHLGNHIVEAFGDGSRYGMRLAYSHEPVILGTGGGIKQAQPYFEDRPVLVLNGDTLSDCDLTALLKTHRARRALATLAVREDPHAAEWGAITMNADWRILQIKGEPPVIGSLDARAPYMFAGVHVLEPAVLETIPSGPGSIINVYIELLRREKPLTGFQMNGYWSDIGTLERYTAAREDVSRGLLRLAMQEPIAGGDGVKPSTGQAR